LNLPSLALAKRTRRRTTMMRILTRVKFFNSFSCSPAGVEHVFVEFDAVLDKFGRIRVG
jgi:hypothetical protein